MNALRNKSDHAALDDQVSWFQHREGNREEELALQSALGELPEDQRATVIMRIWGGMTLEEVGDATEVPLSTAASRYRYALENYASASSRGGGSHERAKNG